MSHRLTLPSTLVALLCILAIAVTGCAEGPDAAASASTTEPADVLVEAATVDVPPLPTQAAVRLRVVNGTDADDALVEATSPVAERVTLHRSSIDDAGRSIMRRVDRIDVAARSTVRFEAGGLHVMLTGLTEPLVAGETVRLRLRFEHAGWRTVAVEVLPLGSTLAGGEDHTDHD